jgi:hypothetical protein
MVANKHRGFRTSIGNQGRQAAKGRGMPTSSNNDVYFSLGFTAGALESAAHDAPLRPARVLIVYERMINCLRQTKVRFGVRSGKAQGEHSESALPPKAEVGHTSLHVCFGPKADISETEQ